MPSRWVRGIAALLLAAVAAATPARPAAARVTSTSDGVVDVVYDLRFESFQFDSAGESAPIGDPGTGRIALQCGAERCRVVDAWGGIVVPDDTVLAALGDAAWELPGRLKASGARSGTICGESPAFTPDWSTALALDGDGVTGSVVGEPISEECAGIDTFRAFEPGRRSVITASTLIEGACWFTDEGCVTASATPTESPSPTPSASTSSPTFSPSASAGTETPEPTPAAALNSSQLGTGSPAAPSVLSALATPAEAAVSAQQLMWGGILTLILIVLVAFPTALLNSAVEQGNDRFSNWWTGRHTTGRTGTGWNRTWPWAALGVLLAAILSSFVDPSFGLNPGSGRVLLSILVSFAIDVVIGWAVTVWLVRAAVPRATHAYGFQPATLLIVVVAVVFTRLTHFEPGIVFGLVAGVAFGALAGRADEGRAALVPMIYAYLLGLLGWLGYAAMGGGEASGRSFWDTFAVETLSAMAIAGMAALPIALFPVRGLAGQAIFRWSRSLWVACYVVGLLSFFVVLMPMPSSWDEVGLDLIVWVALYVAYAVVAVVAWLAVSGRAPADGAAEGESTGGVRGSGSG
ncbi:hypothetical protein AAIB33_08545 [Microbacterium sp. AZCO]|uniref:hypothetical protein n=1 Tax=Microbacterium sp. AZCO TaxID=3142976 RepID=UPI0031F390BD